jgi:zinc transporter
MPEEDGLVCAYILSNEGQWNAATWDDINRWQPADGLLWVHLDRSAEKARDYLNNKSGLDKLITDSLLAEETRPRSLEINGNLLINLRGVNLNAGADPDDMVSLRLWLESNRIITTRHRRLMAVSEISERISSGRGPKNTGDFLVEVTARLVDRMSPVIEGLDESEDEIEDMVVTGEYENLRSELAKIRREAISLRRYLSPQREAMSRLQSETIEWLSAGQKARLREVSDRIIRYVEDLDSIRERAAVIQDEVANRVSEQINNNMFILAVVATVLLPLGFVTGLLGINVDGMPGAKDAPWAFWQVTGALAVFVVIEVIIMKKLKWF